MSPEVHKQLPELRADLQVVHAAEQSGFVVFDPVRQQYFRIDDVTAMLLRLWPRCRTPGELLEVARRHDVGTDEAQVSALSKFLVSNYLAIRREVGAWRHLAEIERRQSGTWLSWLVHNYLFVRVPLANPQRLLDAWAPRLTFLFSRTAALLIGFAGVTGLYFVSRQWNAFLATFTDFLSFEGAIAFTLGLLVVKSLHELGHALTAVRFGCRVPSVGVCFMVLAPMLYTDVTDSWRLSSRRQRFFIGASGLIVEISVACVALLLWAFLPDGLARSIAFVLATGSLLISLGVNLNPLMRFDGYYLLSDAIGVENLQPRAFEIGVWKLREWLFALGRPPPEPMSRRYLVALSMYAYAAWIYRLMLFLGIALLVYGIGFKLLGIVLFLIEIVVFIGRPIMSEFKAWFALRGEIAKRRRGLYVAAALLIFAVSCFMPLSTSIRVPALLDDREMVQLFPRRATTVAMLHVKGQQSLAAGAPVVTLRAPDLDHEIELTTLRIKAASMRLQRRAGSPEDLRDTLLLQQTMEALRSRLAGLMQERAELDVTMPFDGVVAELVQSLHPGRSLSRGEPVALVTGGKQCRVRGYVGEDQIARIDPSAPARFVSENVLDGVRMIVGLEVSTAGADALELPDLASRYGGAVAARLLSRNRSEPPILAPVVGQFLFSGTVEGGCASVVATRGTLHVSARPESLAARVWRQVLKVLVRESGV